MFFFSLLFTFAYISLWVYAVRYHRRRRRRRVMSLSLCAVCTWPVVVARGQVAVHITAAKACVPGLQRPHPRARSLEVSVHGLTPYGHGRLAGVRDSWDRPGNFVVLDGTVQYGNTICPLYTPSYRTVTPSVPMQRVQQVITVKQPRMISKLGAGPAIIACIFRPGCSRLSSRWRVHATLQI